MSKSQNAMSVMAELVVRTAPAKLTGFRPKYAAGRSHVLTRSDRLIFDETETPP
jgi:hypothetical protein